MLACIRSGLVHTMNTYYFHVLLVTRHDNINLLSNNLKLSYLLEKFTVFERMTTRLLPGLQLPVMPMMSAVFLYT